jgi:hypothetical protein
METAVGDMLKPSVLASNSEELRILDQGKLGLVLYQHQKDLAEWFFSAFQTNFPASCRNGAKRVEVLMGEMGKMSDRFLGNVQLPTPPA